MAEFVETFDWWGRVQIICGWILPYVPWVGTLIAGVISYFKGMPLIEVWAWASWAFLCLQCSRIAFQHLYEISHKPLSINAFERDCFFDGYMSVPPGQEKSMLNLALTVQNKSKIDVGISSVKFDNCVLDANWSVRHIVNQIGIIERKVAEWGNFKIIPGDITAIRAHIYIPTIPTETVSIKRTIYIKDTLGFSYTVEGIIFLKSGALPNHQ